MKKILLLLTSVMLGCAAPGAAPTEQIEYVELDRGQHSGRESQYFELVIAAERLAEVWRQIGEAPPSVDFQRQHVIVLFMGQQRSGGHSVSASSVTRRDDNLYVRVLRRVPGSGCMTTMALTSPYQVIVVPAGAMRAEFSVETEQVNCQ